MDTLNTSSPETTLQVRTVLGPMSYTDLGVTDSHNHVWIDEVPGSDRTSPVLNQFDEIKQELIEYRLSGGSTILDCQPGECGRDGNQLRKLSQKSDVNLIACTGFHRRKYYSQDHWLWTVTAEKAAEYFCAELETNLVETVGSSDPIVAGFIKIALEENWKDIPESALEGAAIAAARTRSLIEIHTEKGRLAEKACIYFYDLGVAPNQLVFCHMDKRPDLCLHKELAHFGVLLEYDTFFRPKYSPFQHLWPLLVDMVHSGWGDRIALATDMAESAMYRSIGKGPGLQSLPLDIRKQLGTKGIPEQTIQQLLGGNIARRLAGLN